MLVYGVWVGVLVFGVYLIGCLLLLCIGCLIVFGITVWLFALLWFGCLELLV